MYPSKDAGELDDRSRLSTTAIRTPNARDKLSFESQEEQAHTMIDAQPVKQRQIFHSLFQKAVH